MDNFKLLNKVNSILFSTWDPIGVNSNLNLSDEYFVYAKEITILLKDGADDKKLADYLMTREVNDIGTSEPVKTIANTVWELKKMGFTEK